MTTAAGGLYSKCTIVEINRETEYHEDVSGFGDNNGSVVQVSQTRPGCPPSCELFGFGQVARIGGEMFPVSLCIVHN